MADEIEDLDFGSTENAIRYIKEKSDDIQKAIIPQSKETNIYTAGKLHMTYRHVGLVLLMMTGHQHVMGRKDAEAVLNDGILARMRIPIEFGREPGDTEEGMKFTQYS